MTKPNIGPDEIRHVAQLAQLSLSAEEATAMTHELGRILDYVRELDSLDTSDVPPTANVQLGPTAWREDVVVEGVSHDEALSQAPRSSQGGFAVPAFVE